MQLRVLFGQRFQGMAPEALEVVDEYTDDETSGVWLHEQLHEYQETGDFESFRIVAIDIPRDDLDLIFKPKPLSGTVSADN